MKNSDNVVRLGLTPKHKDTKTLLQILDYEDRNIEALKK
jgi:mannose-6-phosphate isomerase class I